MSESRIGPATSPQEYGQPSGAAARAGDEDSYRAVCVPAVVSLLLGLASWTAFFSYLAWAVPLLAIGVGAYALWQIRRYWPTLSGKLAARCGIALAIAIWLAAVVQGGAHRWALTSESTRVADLWVELLREGEFHKAHQLTLDPQARMALDVNLPRGYDDQPSLRANFEEFRGADPVERLSNLPDSARVRRVELSEITEGAKTARLVAKYQVSHAKVPTAEDFYIGLVMYRLPDPKSGERTWRVILDPQIQPVLPPEPQENFPLPADAGP